MEETISGGGSDRSPEGVFTVTQTRSKDQMLGSPTKNGQEDEALAEAERQSRRQDGQTPDGEAGEGGAMSNSNQDPQKTESPCGHLLIDDGQTVRDTGQ